MGGRFQVWVRMSNKMADKSMTGTSKLTLVPKLRFPEFQDVEEWAIKPLSKVARITQGGTPKTSVPAYWGGEIQWITPAEMGKNDSPYVTQTVRTITHDGLKNCSSELLPEYSVILSTRAPIGHLAINVVPMAINQGCRGIVAEANFDSKFIYYAIGNNKARLENLGAGNTFKELSGSALKEFTTFFPQKVEQQKIADCLSSVDELITLGVQKLNMLKTHKAGLMQQLFPAGDDTQPNLRFPEFHDAGEWERYSLRTVAQLLDGDWIESKDQSETGVRLIQTGNIGIGSFISKENNARFISEESFDRLRCTEVFPGDCLISRLPDPAGRSCLVPEIGRRMITAVDCTVVRFDERKIVPYFFISFSQTNQYFSEIQAQASGSTRLRISRENLSNISIPLASILEQQKIADCLSSIDELITLETQRLDALKTHKKGLMQQLFPSLDEV